MDALQSPNPPSFMRRGLRQTGTLSPGRWPTLSYSMSPGRYVEMCFFPNLKTGMPHDGDGADGDAEVTAETY